MSIQRINSYCFYSMLNATSLWNMQENRQDCSSNSDHITHDALWAKVAAPSPGGACERGNVCRLLLLGCWSKNCLTGRWGDLCTGDRKEKLVFLESLRQFASQRGGRLGSYKWFVRVSATGHRAKCQGLLQPSAKGSATSTPQRGKSSGGENANGAKIPKSNKMGTM